MVIIPQYPTAETKLQALGDLLPVIDISLLSAPLASGAFEAKSLRSILLGVKLNKLQSTLLP